ncbi:MAG: sugar transferase [Candidatus Baltobacteraceae bacterium]|jgi:exopolysaccharide biosynthesis polyprenyl glycosylphosphotransferase
MITSKPGGIDKTLGAVSRLKPRPSPARYGLEWSLVLLSCDLLVFGVAGYASQFVTGESFAALAQKPAACTAALFALGMWLLIFERVGLYRRTFAVNARDEVYATLAASALAVLAPLALAGLDPALFPLRRLLLASMALATVGASLARFGTHALQSALLPARTRRVAVVGTPERVSALPADLSLAGGDTVLRFPTENFDDELAEARQGGDLGRLDWLQAALAHGCNELIVTEALPCEIVPGLLRLTEAHGITLSLAPMRIRPYACDYRVRRDGGLTLLQTRSLTIATPGADLFRRVMDAVLVVPAIVVLALPMALIALAVYVDSGGPVLYRQTRVGKLGREFDILKFRTMRPDAEAQTGPVWARNGESRTTRIGRFLRRTSLDELPQLFNVLRGDMSIVGPRPERPFYVEQFRKMFRRYDERHLVRPGITGWAQINMQRTLDPSEIGEKLSYDLFYLEHWSPFIDLLVICKTAAEFLFQRAA